MLHKKQDSGNLRFRWIEMRHPNRPFVPTEPCYYQTHNLIHSVNKVYVPEHQKVVLNLVRLKVEKDYALYTSI